MKKLIFVLSFAAFVSACNKKNSSSPSYTASCSGNAKSYQTDVSPVITSNCTGCHSQYNTYSNIVADRTKIRSTIADGSMPQKSSMTDAQKNAVICWIDSGCANN